MILVNGPMTGSQSEWRNEMRPPLSPDSPTSAMLLRMPEDVHESVRQAAADESISTSEWVRRAVAARLTEKGDEHAAA